MPGLAYLSKMILSITPDSMRVERAVSCLNNFKTPDRASTVLDTLSDRMTISLNGRGTAEYDPRPAVAKFLKKKERRHKQPDIDTYKRQPFVAKFFK